MLLSRYLTKNRRCRVYIEDDPEAGKALTNYETSPMRWSYDALLAEYAALRQEIVLVKEQMERTYVYLLTLLGGVLASQLIASWGESLNKHPWVYLVIALLSLWFPVNNLTMSIDVIALGKYLRDVNAVRLNAISETVSRAATTAYGTSSKTVLGWPEETSAISSSSRDYSLSRGPMNWEEFIAFLRPGRGLLQRAALFPVYVARIGFLYSPALLLLIVFFARVPHVEVYEVALLVIIFALVGCIIAATFSVGSIMSFNMRSGVYRDS